MPPRPRPRPRGANSVSNSSSDVVPPQASSSTSGARHNIATKEDDEDAMFMRNRERNLQDVSKRLEKAAAMAITSSSSASSDNEVEDEETPRKGVNKVRKRNMFKAGPPNTLPTWTKKGGIQSLLRDSDSDPENNLSVFESSPSKRRRAGASGSNAGTPRGKGSRSTRSRSRSRSLTPPPALTEAQKIRTQQAVQRALGGQFEDVRPPSPEMDDPDDAIDTAQLAPELQAILHDRERRAENKALSHCPGLTHHPNGELTNVSVRVKWIWHPEDDAMFGRPPPTWAFSVKRHDSLKELFSQLADQAHILPDDLVLLRDRKQVFQLVSLEGLGVWDHVDFEACDRSTFEALRSWQFRSPTPASHNEEDSNVPGRELSTAPSDTLVEPDDDNKFKIVLRAKGTKDVTLSVRPTTTCGKIARAFLGVIVKHGAKLSGSPRKNTQVRLCVDGDKMDPDTPIGDCDLEDGDMVEVVGLNISTS